MSEEVEKTSGGEKKGKESRNLGQDDISKLLNEMQSEEKIPETEDQAEKNNDDETKREPDDTKDDENKGEVSNTLDQDAISRLLGEVQDEEKSSETEEAEGTKDPVEKDNEGEKNTETETAEGENNDKEIEEKEGDQEPDEKDKREEDEDNGGFEGLDPDDEIEIDGDPEKETGESDSEETDNKNKKNDEDKDKKSKEDTGGEQTVILKEVKKRSKGKKFKLLILCISLVVIIAVLFGVYVFFKKSGADNIKAEESFQPRQMAKPGNKYSEEQTRQQIKVYESKDILLSDSIIAKLEEITKLRNELLLKEGEIADLIRNYKNGINKVENEILREKRNSGINSFSESIKNKKIEFGMMNGQGQFPGR